ncbi:DoxX family protein [Chthoniobacter flavus Ellin428]|uniref:DoxX family protein n=1 Tax=Chthoniobacter flavus Ellin428 TaxID=497964 RepID=B4DAP7_9BACT|nr:DoxX family protein [Chthoniobacter flavus]EDY16457.1 DoxX family protein [Chthoniobacter flavus Ellin428]TCO92728.1 putative oxidoreductase [Chthoniobacter flavus]
MKFTPVTAYTSLIRLCSSLQPALLFALRIYWGWSFFQTGKGKLMNLDQTTEFFATLHIPFPGINASLAGATECFGGLLLLVGLASRLAALPLVATMIVAYLTAEIEVVENIFNDPDKFTAADPFLFLLATVIVLVFGPGALSLDRLIIRLRHKRSAASMAVPVTAPTPA